MVTVSEALWLYSGIFEESTAGVTIISGRTFVSFCITQIVDVCRDLAVAFILRRRQFCAWAVDLSLPMNKRKWGGYCYFLLYACLYMYRFVQTDDRYKATARLQFSFYKHYIINVDIIHRNLVHMYGYFLG